MNQRRRRRKVHEQEEEEEDRFRNHRKKWVHNQWFQNQMEQGLKGM